MLAEAADASPKPMSAAAIARAIPKFRNAMYAKARNIVATSAPSASIDILKGWTVIGKGRIGARAGGNPLDINRHALRFMRSGGKSVDS